MHLATDYINSGLYHYYQIPLVNVSNYTNFLSVGKLLIQLLSINTLHKLLDVNFYDDLTHTLLLDIKYFKESI